jgi:diadenylate cyclase
MSPTEPIPSELLCDVCSVKRGVNPRTLEEVIVLSVEIAREGREGRKIGTIFVVGDEAAVLERSRPMILDPLLGHPTERKRLSDPDLRETLKELAQLDGAFVISDDGVAVSATRYLDASSLGVPQILGFGARHMAAAAITRNTGAVAVVVSESSVVRVFDNGELISEIIPELWLFSRYGHHISGPLSERKDARLTVVSKSDG